MTIRNLEFFFKPRSVAVIGASDRPGSIGAAVMNNIATGGFNGTIYPVNSRRKSVRGLPTAPNVSALPDAPDLAVICTPAATVPNLIAELGAKGTKAAIVITAGLARETTVNGKPLTVAMLEAARPHLLRIIGPNCLGLTVPGIGLNASFAPSHPLPGKLAFVSQSGALATAILDWGRQQGIGFSCCVTVGESLDVDFGDLLDYLGRDPETSAILLYIESIKSARKFMSAARAAARAKPVIAVKAGRVDAGARAAMSHTGALAGDDAIVDAALRRAGILRVETTQDLFDAAETLARIKPTTGHRVAMFTNGGGAGVMAIDAFVGAGGTLATLDTDTVTALDAVLPRTWSRANPVDIIGDAPVTRYVDTLQALLRGAAVDAVLLLHAPTAVALSADIATGLVPSIIDSGKNVYTCFLGGDAVGEARRIMARHQIPTYATPEAASRALLQIANFDRNQTLLMETPPAEDARADIDLAAIERIISSALAEDRAVLNEVEAKAILAAAGIPVVRTEIARDDEHAITLARTIGFPVALKVFAPGVSHKSDVGGVALHLSTEAEVRLAAQQIRQRIQAAHPNVGITGFTVQAMAPTGNAHELIVGSVNDPVFGPVVMFGQGGTAVEVVHDRAFALPPLNLPLTRDLVARTRVAALLAGYRDRPAAALEILYGVIMQVARLVSSVAEIEELDINPLLLDADQALALDARIRVGRRSETAQSRLAIQPYPSELEESLTIDGTVMIVRPIRPTDEASHHAFLQRVDASDLYFRFFHVIKDWSHQQLARLTQIDYDREMALIAVRVSTAGAEQIFGVARCIADPDNQDAEFAILVQSDFHGHGLGHTLMQRLIAYSTRRGTRRLVGYVLNENSPMLTLASTLGFKIVSRADRGVVEIALDLQRDSPSQ
jgi:acetyltransferase